MTKLLVFTFLSIPLIGAYVMFGLGIVVIYRASRVLNLAHGAMAMVPAYVYYSLTKSGVPPVLALLLSVLAGAVLGVLVELVFVRRLRPQGSTAQTVGTVAVTGLLIALVGKIYGTASIQPKPIFPSGQVTVAHASVRYGELGLLLVGLTVAAALLAFFRYTEFGLALRGAAQNRTAATLMGINPNVAASSAWALGGALAALGGVLLAAVTNLNPYTLSLEVLPAFVAALLGGLESLGGAIIGAIVAGLAFGLVPLVGTLPVVGRIFRLPGSSQLVLTVLTLGVMVGRGRRLAGSATDEIALGTSGASRGRPPKLRPAHLLFLVPLIAWPWIVPFSVLGSSLLALEFAVVALSLVVLTGWVGQISLAQATFVGIGALVTAMVARGTGLGFPLDVFVGVLAAAGAAVILGGIALRVRGLYLAVTTLIFAWMGDAFLFPSPWLGLGGGSSTVPNQQIGHHGGILSLDFTNRKVLFTAFVIIGALVAAALANLRDTKTGRAFFAVRGSEMAAASLGIDVVRYKLVAFATAGALAGLGGGLLMVEQRTVVPNQFFFTMSLQYLAIAVVGGLGSIPGAFAAGAVFAALNEVFFRVSALAGWLDVVSAALLAFVLLAYPGGIAAAARSVQERVVKLRHSRTGARPAVAAAAVEAETPAVPIQASEESRLVEAAVHDGPELLLEAGNVTVQFGGLTAVKDASVRVHRNQIVGLIGPNGAGKTTMFNAILGLNEPVAGQIIINGHDATAIPAHRRAALGVARTFQVLQLFGGLTVFDNLLVATHLHNGSGVLGNLVASPSTLAREAQCRRDVTRVLRLLGLQDVAQETVGNLPFGVLRLVELGRALVTGSKLLMLDEAASGLNDQETDRLIQVIRDVAATGVSVLLIEHDVRMVSTVCDYIYVMDQGEVIAEGEPKDVTRNPKVVAAYLGAPPDEVDLTTSESPTETTAELTAVG